MEYWYTQQIAACIKNQSKYFDHDFFQKYQNVITFKNYDNPLYFLETPKIIPGNEKNKKLFMNVELMLLLIEHLQISILQSPQGYDHIFSELELDEFYSKIDNSKIKK